MKLTVLVEDRSDNEFLDAIHGVSFFIELNDGYTILFDTGQKDLFLRNASKLNIQPLKSNICVISHNHYDHSGGLNYLIEKDYSNPIYIHKRFFDRKFSLKNNALALATGISKENSNNFVYVDSDIFEVRDGLYILSNVEFTNDFEKIPSNFVIKNDDKIVQDTFKDEISLVLKTSKGLVIVSGCSHRGIINILTSVKKRFNEEIYAFIGGNASNWSF